MIQFIVEVTINYGRGQQIVSSFPRIRTNKDIDTGVRQKEMKRDVYYQKGDIGGHGAELASGLAKLPWNQLPTSSGEQVCWLTQWLKAEEKAYCHRALMKRSKPPFPHCSMKRSTATCASFNAFAKFTSPKLTHPSCTGMLRGETTRSCSSVGTLSHKKKIKLQKRRFHQYDLSSSSSVRQ